MWIATPRVMGIHDRVHHAFESGKHAIASSLAAATLTFGAAFAQSPQHDLNLIGDAAQLPSNARHLERLNAMTLDELGLCDANYTSSVDVLSPSFRRHNLDLSRSLSASRIVDRLPESTREYLAQESGLDPSRIATFNVNYEGSDPRPSDRLIVELGVHARPHNVVTEHSGVRRNRFASEVVELEIEGHHARAIADTLEAVCADTRFGELRTITGDQYLEVLRAAASGFEALYGENSSLREEIHRLELSLSIERERTPSDVRDDAPARGADVDLPGVRYDRPELPSASYDPLVGQPPAPEPSGPASLEDRVKLDIAYFKPGVPETFETFAGSYTALLSDDGSRLVIDGEGYRSEVALDANVRLAYRVDPVDGLENAHRSHVYANPQGWRFDVLAVTQDSTLIAYREGPHDAHEVFTTQERWTSAALPHSFEGYAAADGWTRTDGEYAPVNVTNVTGELGRSIRIGTEE